MITFERTADHEPEPGLGGSDYRVYADGEWIGKVTSTWNRTDGVHWVATDTNLAPIRSGRYPRAFENRKAATQALERRANRDDASHGVQLRPVLDPTIYEELPACFARCGETVAFSVWNDVGSEVFACRDHVGDAAGNLAKQAVPS